MTLHCGAIVAAMTGAAPAGGSGPGGAAAPPAGRPLRQDARRTVARVVEVATRVLADSPEATMQEIADAAGLGRATVYRHFASREDLMAAITLEAFRQMREALDGLRLGEGDVVAALHRALATFFEVGDRYRFLAQHPDAPVRGAEKEAAVRELFAPVGDLLERAQAEGVVRAGLPLDWVRASLGALLKTAFEQVDAGVLDRADAPGLVVRTFLGGAGVGVSADTGAPS